MPERGPPRFQVTAIVASAPIDVVRYDPSNPVVRAVSRVAQLAIGELAAPVRRGRARGVGRLRLYLFRAAPRVSSSASAQQATTRAHGDRATSPTALLLYRRASPYRSLRGDVKTLAVGGASLTLPCRLIPMFGYPLAVIQPQHALMGAASFPSS